MYKSVIAAALISTAGAAQAITIEFDYSYDSGFLTQDYRDVLDAVAGEFGSRITDSLAAINSSGVNSYRGAIGLLTDSGPLLTAPISVAADTVRVYVGTQALGGTTLGIGGSGYSAGGTNDFFDLLATRGQPEPSSVNFTPVTGQIVFDMDTNWYLDDDVTTVESFSGLFDFYSIAVHELGHVLGVGASDAWSNQISGSTFTGSNAVSVFGGPVPLANSGHVAKSITSTFMGELQEPALTPSISIGQRKYLTDLDWALLADVGWEVAPVTAVPEAQTWAMMLAGLGLLGWHSRRRRQA